MVTVCGCPFVPQDRWEKSFHFLGNYLIQMRPRPVRPAARGPVRSELALTRWYLIWDTLTRHERHNSKYFSRRGQQCHVVLPTLKWFQNKENSRWFLLKIRLMFPPFLQNRRKLLRCITETSFSLGKKGAFLLVYKCVAGCKSFPKWRWCWWWWWRCRACLAWLVEEW